MRQNESPTLGLPSSLTGAAVMDDNEKFCASRGIQKIRT